jgi:hypothetical protein
MPGTDHGDRRCAGPEHDAVPQPLQVASDVELVHRRRGEADQDRRRQNEARRERQAAGQQRDERAPTVEHDPLRGPRAVRCRRKPGPPARAQFEGHQNQHDRKQYAGQLAGRDAIAEREPGTVDRGGKGLQAEVRRRAVIGHGLHQRQRSPRSHCRPRHWQVDAQPAADRREAQRTRRVGHRSGAREEGGARQKVDVGVKRDREDERRAGDRADFREPVLAALPAEVSPQTALQRSGELQKIRVCVGDDVGRHRQRHQQCPLESAAARKVIRRNQPGRSRAKHDHARPDQSNEDCRLACRTRDDGGSEMLQRVQRHGQVGETGQHAEQREQHRGGAQRGKQHRRQRQRDAPPAMRAGRRRQSCSGAQASNAT